MTPDYIPRLVDSTVSNLLASAPAIMLTGPRASGKTTTALRHAKTTARLDRPREAIAFRADADAALGALQTPLLIDEWQVVPEVLGAVKRAVDSDSTPGQFIITGNVRSDLNDQTWPGTGRVIRVPVWPLTQRELAGQADAPGLLDRIIQNGIGAAVAPGVSPDLPGYLDLAVAGGFPSVAMNSNAEYQFQWHNSYLEQLVTRDAAGIDGARDPVRLRRFLDVLAENTAGLPSDAALLDASSLNRRTAEAYDRLLQALGIVDVVPAWASNRLKRLTQRGKRYLTDTGLTAAALRVDARDVLRDGVLLGRILDAYVAMQIRSEVSASILTPRLHHLRDRDGREIDLLLDYGRRGLIAIEIKASAAPTRADAAHLIWFQEQFPDLRAGLILHTGPRAYQLHEGIAAIPIASLWQSPETR